MVLIIAQYKFNKLYCIHCIVKKSASEFCSVLGRIVVPAFDLHYSASVAELNSCFLL